LKRWKATIFRPAGGKVGILIVPGRKMEIPRSANCHPSLTRSLPALAKQYTIFNPPP